MGCINSRSNISDLHSNIFHVMNVDDLGNLITSGRLEVTDLDIILHQRGKQLVKWPLRCLRRYGYDAEIFSFESGRRCSTGPGIYAFKCHRAAQLFNLVQTNIQACNNSSDDTISREIPPPLSGPTVARSSIPSEPNYLDPTTTRSNNQCGPRLSHNQQNGIARLSSIESNSAPISPQDTLRSPSPLLTLPPPPPIPSLPASSLYVNEAVLSSFTPDIEHNNNKELKRMMERSSLDNNTASHNGFGSIELQLSKSNQDSIIQNRPNLLPVSTYMNVDISSDASPLSPSQSILDYTPSKEESHQVEGGGHAYININPRRDHLDIQSMKPRPPPLPRLLTSESGGDGTKHYYANLEANELDGLRKRFSATSITDKSPPPLPPSTPPSSVIREVNYAVLDLDKKDSDNQVTDQVTALPSPPESPNRSQKGYATIDFNKTAALSHSVNSNIVNDSEGLRRTRHNSTISELAACQSKHSPSISD